MEKTKLLEEELNLVQDEELRTLVREFLETVVPAAFWEKPASSSGRYHPKIDREEQGTVMHTKYVCAWAKELMVLNQVSNDIVVRADEIFAACILHDTFNYGYTESEHTVTAHPQIAAVEWYKFCQKKKYKKVVRITNICEMIRCHMGQWGYSFPDYTDDTIAECCEFVHLCDYIASRKLIDGLEE